MQRLSSGILEKARYTKMKKLEENLKKELGSYVTGQRVVCPFCKYESKKNKRGTAIVFKDGDALGIKCFACGKWRRL